MVKEGGSDDLRTDLSLHLSSLNRTLDSETAKSRTTVFLRTSFSSSDPSLHQIPIRRTPGNSRIHQQIIMVIAFYMKSVKPYPANLRTKKEKRTSAHLLHNLQISILDNERQNNIDRDKNHKRDSKPQRLTTKQTRCENEFKKEQIWWKNSSTGEDAEKRSLLSLAIYFNRSTDKEIKRDKTLRG